MNHHLHQEMGSCLHWRDALDSTRLGPQSRGRGAGGEENFMYSVLPTEISEKICLNALQRTESETAVTILSKFSCLPLFWKLVIHNS